MKPHTSLTGLLAMLAGFFVALAAGAQTNAAAQSNIGVAAATRNQVEGVFNSQTQPVAVGNSVFSNEMIRTGEDSLAQLLFLDQTSLSVAPKSEVTLDRFVYNPGNNAGTVSLHATIGAFRFVTGSQNPRNYRIETPVATISVRGTILDLLVWSDYTIVIIQEGSATVTSLRTQLSYDLNQPGTALIVWASGRVEGPITWDSTLIHVNGQVPFPLFGNLVWPTPIPFSLYNQNDAQKSLNDLLNVGSSGGNGGCPPGTIRITVPIVACSFVSDVRLKRDITPLKQLDNGLTLYRYRYLWSDTAYVGVMAQDVAKTRPDAIVEGQDGYLRVLYDRLGLKMQTWRSWLMSQGVMDPE